MIERVTCSGVMELKVLCVFIRLFFFFKQKTAYEIRNCDWSSDVCSSDLKKKKKRLCGDARRKRKDQLQRAAREEVQGSREEERKEKERRRQEGNEEREEGNKRTQIGRASCRERV